MTEILVGKAPRGAVALFCVPPRQMKDWLQKQDAATRRWIELQRFEAKAGSHCVVPDASGGVRCVVAGISDPVSLWDLAGLPRALPEGVYALHGIDDVACLEKLALGWVLGAAKPLTYKKRGAEKKTASLSVGGALNLASVRRMAAALLKARELITTPADRMTPQTLAEEFVALAKTNGAKIAQIKGDDLLRRGYPAIHAVGRASVDAPRLVDMRWGNPKHKSLTLVAKGVCFDTGGLNLKPGRSMFLMKKDMAGAACVLALASLIMESKLPIHLRLLVPCVENAIGSKAFRPSDVIAMRGGHTVEIGNTDAEGRLVVAEALAEAAAEKPDLIVDLATLGGGRGIFGPEMAALFASDEALSASLVEAGTETEDPVWPLPLAACYESWLDSPMADMNSSPELPYGMAILAALFLQRFVGKDRPWIHLDFMAWNTSSRAGRPAGGEAQTVRALYRFLEGWSRRK